MIIPLLLFIISFFYRFYGLLNNHPFWYDEFSTADQAKLLTHHSIHVFFNPHIHFEVTKIFATLLTAIGFKLFGLSEWAARVPFVIVGACIPVFLYFFVKNLFNRNTAIMAALLTAFSYVEITWSRQARGYILQQFLVIAILVVYQKIIQQKKLDRKLLSILSSLMVLSFFTHPFMLFLNGTLLLHYLLISNKNKLNKVIILSIITFAFGLLFVALTSILSNNLGSGLVSKANNLGFYHSFLSSHYEALMLLAVMGFMIGFKLNTKMNILILAHFILHMFFIVFLFTPYVSRYLLPIYLYFFIYAAVMLDEVSVTIKKTLFSDNNELFILGIGLCLTFGFIINSNGFANKPQRFYSVNHDFREIALIDYDQFYKIVKSKYNNRTAVIDTWPDRLNWYMGKKIQNGFAFRWINNGPMKRTAYLSKADGSKVLYKREDIGFIATIKDLNIIMKKYDQVFFFIDDESISGEVVNYVKKNYKRELFLDHYPLDDNPYSIWPATLYSWKRASK